MPPRFTPWKKERHRRVIPALVSLVLPLSLGLLSDGRRGLHSIRQPKATPQTQLDEATKKAAGPIQAKLDETTRELEAERKNRTEEIAHAKAPLLAKIMELQAALQSPKQQNAVPSTFKSDQLEFR